MDRFSINYVARQMGVSTTAVRKWLKEFNIQVATTNEGWRIFTQNDIDTIAECLEKRRMKNKNAKN